MGTKQVSGRKPFFRARSPSRRTVHVRVFLQGFRWVGDAGSTIQELAPSLPAGICADSHQCSTLAWVRQTASCGCALLPCSQGNSLQV